MVMEDDVTLGGRLTIQYTDDVASNCIPKTYTI